MPQPILRPGQRIWLQIDNQGKVVGSSTVFIGTHPPRGQGYWIEITECVNTCCTTTSSTTTTTTTEGE